MFEPIIPGTEIDKFCEQISQIAQILREKNSSLGENIGLFNGKMGIVLFFFYYARWSGQQCYYDYAVKLISSIFDHIENRIDTSDFCSGLAGIGWALNHLKEYRFIELGDDILKDMSPFLYEAMRADLRSGHYDLLYGAIGKALFFLHPSPGAKMKSYLRQMVEGLEAISQNDTTLGIKWRDPTFERRYNEPVYNLGLAHGIPCIIVFLAKMVGAGIHRKKSLAMLSQAVAYLLSQALDKESGSYYSRFPDYVCKGEPLKSSRLAWCYGDPGVAISLWLASQSTCRSEWAQYAVDLLLYSAQRRDPLKNGVKGMGLCHGTAGIAHIFNRAYHYTGIDDFRESAHYWFKQTIKEVPTAVELNRASLEQLKIELPLLLGLCGTGLALMSAVDDIEPGWDSCMFLSQKNSQW